MPCYNNIYKFLELKLDKCINFNQNSNILLQFEGFLRDVLFFIYLAIEKLRYNFYTERRKLNISWPLEYIEMLIYSIRWASAVHPDRWISSVCIQMFL